MRARAPHLSGPGRRAIQLATLLLALAAAPAPAQESMQEPTQEPAPRPKRGGGFWVDAGAGYAWLRLTSGQNLVNGQTLRGSTAAHGMAVTITAGGAPSPNVLMGVQVQQWTSAGGAVAQRVRSVIGVVQWYPWASMGFYLRAGTGIVQGPVAPNDSLGQPSSAQGTGVALAFGVGWDIKVAPHFGLALQVATHINALGDLTAGGQVNNDVIAYVSRIGVALVYR
jgi:hypothetical protein